MSRALPTASTSASPSAPPPRWSDRTPGTAARSPTKQRCVPSAPSSESSASGAATYSPEREVPAGSAASPNWTSQTKTRRSGRYAESAWSGRRSRYRRGPSERTQKGYPPSARPRRPSPRNSSHSAMAPRRRSAQYPIPTASMNAVNPSTTARAPWVPSGSSAIASRTAPDDTRREPTERPGQSEVIGRVTVGSTATT